MASSLGVTHKVSDGSCDREMPSRSFKLLIGQQATKRRRTRAIDHDRTAQSSFPLPILTRENMSFACLLSHKLPRARLVKAFAGPAM